MTARNTNVSKMCIFSHSAALCVIFFFILVNYLCIDSIFILSFTNVLDGNNTTELRTQALYVFLYVFLSLPATTVYL